MHKYNLIFLFILTSMLFACIPTEQICGDKICQSGENASCQSDCPQFCGDLECNNGETARTCPKDCANTNSCTDTDLGNMPKTKGTVSGQNQGLNYSNEDNCLNNVKLNEFYCKEKKKAIEIITCQTTCQNGACIDIIANTTKYNDTCVDSDFGKIKETYGFVYGNKSGGFFNISDVCESNSSLIEQYCENSQAKNLSYSCEKGCQNAKCIINLPDSCFDSDYGIETNKAGFVNGSYKNATYTLYDYCASNKTIVEYYCSKYQSQINKFDCYYSCQNSICTYPIRIIPIINTTLDIKTTPSGAKIYLNGSFMGLTPKVLNLTSGKSINVTLKLEGYKDNTTIWVLDSLGAYLNRILPIDKENGTLNVTTTPDGFPVEINYTINGIQKRISGQTPWLIDVPPGTATILVKGIPAYSINVKVEGGLTWNLHASPDIPGKKLIAGQSQINISSEPPGAIVYYSNTIIGTTPLIKNDIESETRIFLITKPGYHGVEYMVYLTDKPYVINTTLIPNDVDLSIYGSCNLRTWYSSAPYYQSPDLGFGYAKKTFLTSSFLDMQNQCTQEVYDQLMNQYCSYIQTTPYYNLSFNKERPGLQFGVDLFGFDGHYKISGPSVFGDSLHNCNN